MLMPLHEQERIGATADKDESMRVMRTLDHYNELREASLVLHEYLLTTIVREFDVPDEIWVRFSRALGSNQQSSAAEGRP